MFLAMLELLKSGHLILHEEEGYVSESGTIDAASDTSVSMKEGTSAEELVRIINEE